MDRQNQLTGALANAIVEREQEFPFIAIFPQSWQADSPDGERAIAILVEVCSEYAVDSSRVYLTGLSMGGEPAGLDWPGAAATGLVDQQFPKLVAQNSLPVRWVNFRGLA